MKTKWTMLMTMLLVGLFSTAAFADFGPAGAGHGGDNTNGEANRHRDETCCLYETLFGMGLIVEDEGTHDRTPTQDRLRDDPLGSPNESPPDNQPWRDR